ILVSLALGGCSSRSQRTVPVSTVPNPEIEQSGDAYRMRLDNGPVRSEFTVVGTPEQVFAVVADVYKSLSIPIETIDPAAMVIGNPHHAAQRRFAGERMSTFFNCGSGPWGANADSYRIEMSILTHVAPANPGSVTVRTTVNATGQTLSGASKNQVACGSTGRLEQIIHDRVMNRLAAQMGSGGAR
ncbi:MAG TPA: hypothetical protein VF188_00005, partial [Longimicrobiales bacterium]